MLPGRPYAKADSSAVQPLSDLRLDDEACREREEHREGKVNR